MKQITLVIGLYIFLVTTMSNAAHSGWLLFGGIDAIGYNIAQECTNAEKEVSIEYTKQSQKIITNYYADNIHVDLFDIDQLEKHHLKNIKYILLPIDQYPLLSTQQYQEKIDRVISFAEKQKALLIIPLSIEAFGPQKIINEKTIPEPTSEYGHHLLTCKTYVEEQTQNRKCRIRFIYHNRLFGAGSTQTLINVNIDRLINKAACSWISCSNIPQQLSYAPDLARFIQQYVRYAPHKKTHTICFGGITYPSLNDLGKRIAQTLGKKYREIIYTPTEFFFYHIFSDTLHATIDTSYLQEQTILIEDNIRKTLFPAFSQTGMREAVEEAVFWHLTQKGY